MRNVFPSDKQMSQMRKNEPMLAALWRAIEACGSQRQLAMRISGRKIGKPLSAASITDWLRRGRVPAERVIEVEGASGISRHDLRPDCYPRSKPPGKRKQGAGAGA